MDGSRFDQVARVLGLGMARRRVLGALVGGLPLVVGGRQATRAQQGNQCADFCRDVFPQGRDRGQCPRAAAQGEGLCSACGGDVDRLCVDAAGAQVCCAARQTCGVVGLNDKHGCCLPPGEQLEGGCSNTTLRQCCAGPCAPPNDPSACVVRRCSNVTGACLTPTEEPGIASAGEDDIISEIIEN